jgi:hypothetical protein
MNLVVKFILLATVIATVASCGDAGTFTTEGTKTSERVEK